MNILLVVAAYAACIAASILIADFVTGIFHWAEDTWLAPGQSRFLDTYVTQENIDHHQHPGKIRAGNYWATNRVCIALAAFAAAALLLFQVHLWEPYFILAILSQSNQIHLWAHSSRAPRWVQLLQRYGVLQSPKHHAMHHTTFATNYCAVTEFLNPLLDRNGFWRALESIAVRCGATVQRASEARGGY